ncbi:non-canonical purine NTP pyrophosphatase, rdgB/HAM1 family [Allomeiothermus silvanus DSM 9946]|uniref:dITP/XTP pyrophosphatase n=2 Tax=Allomeiothermus silvanus TaxID=52022 RepID=D7BDS3_ALLS1|nr:non-canonical purine NTP pyrophosphatase, rdgB/HAM1 family [Allomeiothermus silvanus DSM 9946]
MRVLATTTNPLKAQRLQELLRPLGWQVISLAEQQVPIPEVPHLSPLDSALVRAAAAAKASGIPAIADESVFELQVNGKLEHYSMHFGPWNTALERNLRLLERLRGLPIERRGARFITVMALAQPSGALEVFQGETAGLILQRMENQGGIGYDPLFFVTEASKTLADMTPEEREAVSPWRRAVERLVEAQQASKPRLQPSMPAAQPEAKPEPPPPQPTPMRVLVATSNAGKFKELREGLAPLGWQLFSLLDYPFKLPHEDGSTFEDNAMLKAAFATKQVGIPALADDSGLEVEALQGEPGVYSARYGGKSSDTERNLYLLDRLRHVKGEERRAKFVAVLVLAYPDGHLEAYRGEAHGLILEAPRGEGGFGYDPLFYVPEAGKTFAEMSLEEKAHYSHRGKALRALLEAHRNGPPPREIVVLE